MGFSLFEPRASSAGNVSASMHYEQGGVPMVVYPGWYSGVYTRVWYTGIYPGGIYTRVYLSYPGSMYQGGTIPTRVPPGVLYPPGCSG